MEAVLLIARLLLAGIFAMAGLAKLADSEGSRRAITNFGAPKVLAAPLGLLLPLTELAVASALIPTSTAPWGAVGALGLLLVFVAGIGVNLARGRKPDCHCFGQLHSAPAGWETLARNGVLTAVAGLVVWQGWNGNVGPSALAWLGALPATQLLILAGGLVVLVLLAGQWWFLLHLLGQNGRLLVRVEALEARLGLDPVAVPSANGAKQAAGLPVGSQAPPFSLEGLHGETLALESLRSAGKPILLLFTDPGCGPCTAMLPEIGRWQEEHSDKLIISLVSRGKAEENRAKAQEHGLTNVLLQEDWEVSEAYQVSGTPSAVLLTPDGKIGSAVAGGPEAIRSIVGHIVRPQPPIPMVKRVGDKASEVQLTDLEGNTVALEDFQGEETLVLFWNTGCGFCQQMLPHLKEWEATSPEDAPKLLVVSAGAEEANKEMGLTSPVLLDQNFATGRAFGASGTPSAVLVDAEGKVASEVAVGAPAVMELAGARRTT